MQNYHLEQFNQKVSVTYRGESYFVRDNGAICRLRKIGYRKRPLDDKWTFGNPCIRDGYMKICSLGVHRIVATAFLGVQPGDEYVVDHIDTNRRHNSPENLRWVTRLDNILKNPKTLRRIENKWGSIEGLLMDPNSSERTDPLSNRPWIREPIIEERYENDIVNSLTYLAIQRKWKTPSEFPLCPDEIDDYPLYDYASRIALGSVFAHNKYGESFVDAFKVSRDSSCLSVLCSVSNGIKDWAVTKVTYEDGKFVHENCGSFFEHVGAVKEHCKLIGELWTGPEETFDDYC